METQSILNKKYTPINGDFYDKLEAASVQNIRCELIYIDDEDNEHNVISRIEDLYTHDGVEYAVLEEETIRLDQIKNLNGETVVPKHHYKRDFRNDFSTRYYSDELRILVDNTDFYSLTVDKARNIVELKAFQPWDSLDDIQNLKSQLVMISDFMEHNFGLLNDLTDLAPNETGTLEAPFIPARGILINAGLYKVADLLPLSCETIVHNRGSFSVNSLKVRPFKDRHFAENWLTER